MSRPVLFDAVTLCHFAVCGRLGILEQVHGWRDAPRWTEEVEAEIRRGDAAGWPGCLAILTCHWLGSSVLPTIADQQRIVRIWIGLNDGRRPPIRHAGEAQCIYFAEKLGGLVATDDNAAYDFAERRLSVGRVIDTVHILRDAVAAGYVSASDASGIVSSITSAGRHLRSVHPINPGADYFRM